MPRYFIDTDDSVLTVRDEDGHEFADVATASDMANRALPEMALQRRLNRQGQTFTASIRNKAGTILYVATMTFAGEWRVAPSVA